METWKSLMYPLEENQLTLTFSEITYSHSDTHWHAPHSIAGYTRLNYMESGEAIHRYRDKTVPVKEIAEGLGFRGQYFSRLFASRYGVTPTRYRHSLEGYHASHVRIL